MTNWLNLLSDTNPAALKDRVNLSDVVAHHGIDLRVDGERLVGLCPFHDDHDASFAVWQTDEGSELCGCWSCDFAPGDVFDFLQRKLSVGFSKAVELVAGYARDGLPAALRIPERDADAPPPDYSAEVSSARARPLTQLHNFLQSKGLMAPAEWIAAEFRVGVGAQSDLLIPHYSLEGELRAVKWRTETVKPKSKPGSRLDSLYGIWRAHGYKDVVLCEGESDTWAAAWALRDQSVDVLGLPSGVSARPRAEWVDYLRDKRVTLLFDADDAGRRGAASWIGKLIGASEVVRVASLASGEDAVSVGERALLRAVDEAWPYQDPAGLPVTRMGDRYARVNVNTGAVTVITDFVFNVDRLILTEDAGVVFEVRVPGRTGLQQLTSVELASQQRMRDWTAARLLSFKGGSRDLADIIELLKAESLLVPRVTGTTVAGLHDQSFVLPGSTIGAGNWAYVEPAASANLADTLRLDPGDQWSRRLPAVLSGLHASDIITPLLGWTAAAPLRALCPQFPIFALVGGAGWGKTTLLAAVLRSFGFWASAPMTLSATTPHGVATFAASSNAFPVWFDEYRHGARQDTRQALDQILRDAWDGSAAVKGGQGDNKLAIHKTYATAPLAITGEDAFQEQSHAERMIILSIPKDGRNPEAMAELGRLEVTGFGRAYLEWLLRQMRLDCLPAPPAAQNRMEQSRAVAAWGYDLLQQFCREELGYELRPYDDSRLVRTQREMEESPLYVEAVLAALDQLGRDGFPLVWVDGPDLMIRLLQTVQFIDQTDLTLPGGSRAMLQWFAEQWPVEKERGPGGRRIRIRNAAAALNIS